MQSIRTLFNVLRSEAMNLASRIAPRLIREVVVPNKIGKANTVQIWLTTCIVSNFDIGGSSTSRVLVNPGNPGLTGCSNFTYFPRGGPVPSEPIESTVHRDWQPLGYVSSWGGMEVGNGMMYPVSVVDGLVHQMSGWRLQAELKMRRMVKTDLCLVGDAVRTTAGDLPVYDSIIHTTPPFYKHDSSPKHKLGHCYQSALDCTASGELVAIPLLGAGCRGFPNDVACQVASSTVIRWLAGSDQVQETTDAFCLIDPQVADNMVAALELALP